MKICGDRKWVNASLKVVVRISLMYGMIFDLYRNDVCAILVKGNTSNNLRIGDRLCKLSVTPVARFYLLKIFRTPWILSKAI